MKTTTRSAKRFAIRGGEPSPAYEQDPHTGDFAQVEQVGRETGGLAGRGGGDPVLYIVWSIWLLGLGIALIA